MAWLSPVMSSMAVFPQLPVVSSAQVIVQVFPVMPVSGVFGTGSARAPKSALERTVAVAMMERIDILRIGGVKWSRMTEGFASEMVVVTELGRLPGGQFQTTLPL